MDINIDGLPLTKRSKSQLWTTLGKISGLLFSDVFLIGAYHDYEKPNSVDDFLNCFIEEYQELQDTGFSYNETNYIVKINFIICDAPAQCMITCTKGPCDIMDAQCVKMKEIT